MDDNPIMPSPVIVGITCSMQDDATGVRRPYVEGVVRAGGVPILLPPPGPIGRARLNALVRAHLDLCHAVILPGGADPSMEPFGERTHPAAHPVHPDRQRYEIALLHALDERRTMPVLGVCLGMQMMALTSGGALNQHLADDTPTHADHLDDAIHSVRPTDEGAARPVHASIRAGLVVSAHHQAVRDPGRLRIIAVAHDGVSEAIDDPSRPFYLGVQWHPERTADPTLGQGLFDALVRAARR